MRLFFALLALSGCGNEPTAASTVILEVSSLSIAAPQLVGRVEPAGEVAQVVPAGLDGSARVRIELAKQRDPSSPVTYFDRVRVVVDDPGGCTLTARNIPPFVINDADFGEQMQMVVIIECEVVSMIGARQTNSVSYQLRGDGSVVPR